MIFFTHPQRVRLLCLNLAGDFFTHPQRVRLLCLNLAFHRSPIWLYFKHMVYWLTIPQMYSTAWAQQIVVQQWRHLAVWLVCRTYFWSISLSYMGFSMKGGIPSSLDGLFHGQSQSKMDDNSGFCTPILGELHIRPHGWHCWTTSHPNLWPQPSQP